MTGPETCRRCASAALVVTPRNDGTEHVACATCGRRFNRVARQAKDTASAAEQDTTWWAE